MHHFSSPCLHCGTDHDAVAVGPCKGDSSKQVPIRYARRGVRHDGIELFTVWMSGGGCIDRGFHVSEHVTRDGGYLAAAKPCQP